MHFRIEKSKLLANIQHLSMAVPTKNITPMLMNFLVEASEETQVLKITATDLDITVIVKISTEVKEQGKIAVSARSLLEIINSVEEKPIDFRTENEYLKIRCSHSCFSLLCAEHSQYPIVPSVNFDSAFAISAPLFARMVDIASIAVSQEGSRPIFTGILWRITPENHIMVSTDGKKISEVKTIHSLKLEETIEKVINPKGLNLLEKIITDESSEIKYLFEENKVIFSYQNYVVITQVITGRFPDYEKVLINNNPHTLTIDKNIIKQAVKRVALLATEDYFRIKFEISETKITISSFNAEMGDANEEISEFEYTGPDFSIAFNYKFILSIVNIIETDKVKITFAEPENGFVNNQVMIYNHPEVDKYKANILLMPLRLK